MAIDLTMNLEGLGSVATAVIAAGTAVYGFGAYRRQQASIAISELRQSLQSIRTNLSRVDMQMIDSNYMQLGQIIARNFLKRYPGAPNAEAFYAWFSELPNLYVEAVLAESSAQETHTDYVQDRNFQGLEQISAIETNFPVVARILREALILAGHKGAHRLLSVSTVRRALTEARPQFIETVVQMPTDPEDMAALELLLAASIASIYSSFTQMGEQSDFDAMERIVVTLAKWAQEERESRLKGMFYASLSQSSRVNRIRTGTHTGDIRGAAKLIRSYLGSERMATIDAACKVIEDSDSGGSGEAAAA